MKKQVVLTRFSLFVALIGQSAYAQQSDSRPGINRSEFILSRINEPVIRQFKKAWYSAHAGKDAVEAVVLLYVVADGTLVARSLDLTYESRKLSFKWDGAIAAVVHTHPNSCGAEPQGEDLQLGDKFGIPVYTVTDRGMFVYDPDTKKISTVLKGLDWLKPSKWNRNSQLAVATAP